MHRTYKPLPYLSLVVNDCLDNGKEINEGGAHYNATGPQACGIGTLADGLATIKQLDVYKRQAKALGGFNAPISGFVNVLNGNLRGLVVALNAIAEQKGA